MKSPVGVGDEVNLDMRRLWPVLSASTRQNSRRICVAIPDWSSESTKSTADFT